MSRKFWVSTAISIISSMPLMAIADSGSRANELLQIRNQDDGVAANVHLITASGDVASGPLVFISFAEWTAFQLKSSASVPLKGIRLPKKRGEKDREISPSRHLSETLAQGFRSVRGRNFYESETVIPCKASGSYTMRVQGSNADGVYTLTATYNACRTEESVEYQTYWTLDGPVSIRVRVGGRNEIKVLGVRFGDNYGLANAVDYTERFGGVVAEDLDSITRMNFEISGDFMQLTYSDADGYVYGEGPFSYRYNGSFTEMGFAIQNGTTPTPMVNQLIADNVVSTGTFAWKLPRQDNSQFEITHIEGKYSVRRKNDFQDGTVGYTFDRLKLTNRSYVKSIDSTLLDWTIDGAVSISNPPWRSGCPNGKYRYETTARIGNQYAIAGSYPDVGNVTINGNTRISYEQTGPWVYVGRQPPFNAFYTTIPTCMQ